MRIGLDMLVIVLENLSKELVLSMSDRLDDESIVSRKVEEGARFPWRS